jgi:hypothetical protein
MPSKSSGSGFGASKSMVSSSIAKNLSAHTLQISMQWQHVW